MGQRRAARVAGLGPWGVLTRITLPLLRPALTISGILNFVMLLEALSIPLVLGRPANIELLTSFIYTRGMSVSNPDYGLVAASALILVCIVLVLTSLQRLLLRKPERFVTDEQISAGYMHSGYPIMAHLDVVPVAELARQRVREPVERRLAAAGGHGDRDVRAHRPNTFHCVWSSTTPKPSSCRRACARRVVGQSVSSAIQRPPGASLGTQSSTSAHEIASE